MEIIHVNDISSDRAVTLSFDYVPKGWLDRMLIKVGVKPKKITVEVKPIRLGQRERMAKYAEKLDWGKYSDTNLIEAGHKFSIENTGNLIECLAIALNNTDSEPAESLKRSIRALNMEEFDYCANLMASMMDTKRFLSSTILISGMGLKAEEIIASETTSGASKETS